jgi:hypothetical protein
LGSLKIPANNMLSEISEEDDVSIISERNGVISAAKRS